MSGASKGKARLVACEVCGRTMGNTGMGRHMKAHRDAGGAGSTPVLVETPTRAHSHAGEDVTAMDVAVAVLAKVSPDGRVPVDALPDVFSWMEHTDRLVRLIRE